MDFLALELRLSVGFFFFFPAAAAACCSLAGGGAEESQTVCSDCRVPRDLYAGMKAGIRSTDALK